MIDPKKLKKAGEIGYSEWFKKWYESLNLENELLKSAIEGYKSFSITLKEGCKYIRNKEDLRRLEDERIIESLKEKQPKLNISFIKRERYKNALGYYSFTYPAIRISWEEEE